METYIIVAVVAVIVMSVVAFLIGRKMSDGGAEMVAALEMRVGELKETISAHEATIKQMNGQITTLTSERDVEAANARNAEKKVGEMADSHSKAMGELRVSYESQIKDMKESYVKQLAQVKENSEAQLKTLQEMNKKQIEDQLTLIKEQMRTTSEDVLKARQAELETQNKEQVSKIVDPLQKSLKDMETALNNSKEQQKDAMTRLDESIRLSMEKSSSLGETADRLTRALTGEVKVQGNFGELKLKQLLEDMELREGEQFDTQETLRDENGRPIKGDDGKGLIPDFILHFPENRHVVVDSKMSFTAYERYINLEDGNPEKSKALREHIDSVRAQVKLLAKKDYTRFLPSGYNKLNFAIMYIPIEGALNLALLNDNMLWREAYDMGVMILGPQTMYMNLRVLDMMWKQVRQLENQQVMVDAATTIIDRVQDFGQRFNEVETSLNNAVSKVNSLKVTTSDSGRSIITAAKQLLKAGASENRKKKSLDELETSVYLESETSMKKNTNLPPTDENGGSFLNEDC